VIVTIVEHVTITPSGAYRVVYEPRDGSRPPHPAVLIVPQGTPGQERLRKGATVSVTRVRGDLEIREPLASMRMMGVVAVAA
jgi:hypothetical protein